MISLHEFNQLSEEEKMCYMLELASYTNSLSMAIIEELSQKIRILKQENEELRAKYKNSIIIHTNYN